MSTITIKEVTPDNVLEESLFCIKHFKTQGAKDKHAWFNERYAEGLRLKTLKNADNKAIGFIEYIPANLAWRPVDAPQFMFIHCMYIIARAERGAGYGAKLINACEEDAKAHNMAGLCVMTSKGSWLADKRVFEKYGFVQVDQRGRFELLTKTWGEQPTSPKLIDWTTEQAQYRGWHLLYADQCPWHEKAVTVLRQVASEHGIELQVRKLKTAEEAKRAPSGFGVFSLIKDGMLLEDHYISATRFKNILKKALSE